MLSIVRPRLHSPAVLPALRPTTFSSFPPTAQAAALSTLLAVIIQVTRIRLQAKLEHRQGCPGLPPPARHYAKAPRRATAKPAGSASAPGRSAKHLTPPAAAPAATPAPRIRWPELIQQSLEKRAGRR